MNNNASDTTKRYFELSNQGDLSTIKTMFHPEATYSSTNTGLYYGVEDIMVMMQSFFAQFEAIDWHIDALKTHGEHITEVAFTCRTTDLHGTQLKRTGTERLVVAEGLIRHIEVR